MGAALWMPSLLFGAQLGWMQGSPWCQQSHPSAAGIPCGLPSHDGDSFWQFFCNAGGGWHETSAHLVLTLPSCVLQPLPLAESWLPALPAAPCPSVHPSALPLPLLDLPHTRSSLRETLISNFIRSAPADLHNPHNHPGFNCLQLCRKIMWLSGKS